MKDNAKRFLSLSLALAMAASVTACGSSSASDSAAESDSGAAAGAATTEDGGKILNVGNYLNEVFIGSFDPTGAVAPGVCHGADYLVYDTLLTFNGSEYTSRILSDWEWTDDTTFTCTIKDNVTFNNGDPMTAEDVLYTYKTIREQSWMDIWYNFIDIENSTADGQNLTIKTNFPFALADFYFAYAGIVNEDAFEAALEAAGGEYSAVDAFNADFLNGMSSGPYLCTEMAMDSHANYELNPDWWGLEEYGDGMFEQINCYVYSDQTTMAVDMETGKIDLALDCSLQDATRAANGEMENTELGLANQYGNFYLLMSTTSPRIADVNVRRAIACCLDLVSLEEATLGADYGTPCASIIPADCDGYVEDSVIEQYYSYDLDRAAEYLQAAGIGEGELTIQLLCDTSSTNQNLAEVIQAELQAAGIGCEITVADTQAMDSYLDGSGNYDMLIQYSSDNTTATGYADIMNLANSIWPDFCYDNDETFYSGFEKCQQTMDDAERAAALQEFVEYGADQVYWISLFEYSSAYLYNPNVIDIEASYIPSVVSLDLTNVQTK